MPLSVIGSKFLCEYIFSSIMYRSHIEEVSRRSINLLDPDDNLFFERINTPLEKAWLRSENIFLLGDFNCDLSFQRDPDNILHRNTIKLRSIIESFNMHNMIQEATRSTISSISLSQQKGISSAPQEYSHWDYQIMI